MDNKKQPWDNTATTLTEFARLSSEVKPSKNFLSRLWKKDGSDQSNSSSGTASREASIERNVREQREGEILVSENPQNISDLIQDAAREISDDEISHQSEGSYEGQDSRVRINIPKRTLSNVLNRLSNIKDKSASNLTPTTYKDSDFKQYWMPDSSCRECYDCGDRFTTFRRRHHCRVCGQIFCSKCCNQELPGKAIGYKGGIRVCTYCCKVVLKFAQSSGSEYERSQTDDLSISPHESMDYSGSDYNIWSPVSKRASILAEDSTQQREISLDAQSSILPFDLTPQSDFSINDSLLIERKMLSRDSVQLREIWRQIQDPVTGVDMQSHRIRLRTYQKCVVGKELVDWLITNDKAVKRDQGVGIGQALLYADYLESVGSHLNIFKDDFTLYKPGELSTVIELEVSVEGSGNSVEEKSSNEPLWLKEIEFNGEIDDLSFSEETRTDSDRTKSQSETSSRHMFYVGDPSESGSFSGDILKLSTVPRRETEAGEEPMPRQDFSSAGLTDEFLKGTLLTQSVATSSDVISCPHTWRIVDELREENGEKLAYDRLRTVHTEHWNVLAKQLLSHHGLSLNWEPIILTYATKVSHFVRPDIINEGDNPDIRQYLHVKKITGGHKNETCLIHGLVFTKNIAHKKMKSKIINPQIMLLKGSIEYQRVENKFSSLEPQILQEREFLKNSVSKIVKFFPNVLVVEKTVSRLAQEYLLEADITLIFNVKPRVMERLSRFTQADIVSSIDSLVGLPNLGVCHQFRSQSYSLPNGENKTLVIFDGCATHLGCTILLRGALYTELLKVKEIIRFMSYCSYNSLLEISFCMDEFALLPEEEQIDIEHYQTDNDQSEKFSNGGASASSQIEQSVESSATSEPRDSNSTSNAKTGCSAPMVDSNAKETCDNILESNSDKSKSSDVLDQSKLTLNSASSGNKWIFPDISELNTISENSASSDLGNDVTRIVITEAEEQNSDVYVANYIENLTVDKDTRRQVSLSALKTNLKLEKETDTKRQYSLPAETSKLKAEKDSKRQYSVELVELTDESDPLKSYQRSKDESIFHSRLSLKEQKHSNHLRFKKILHDTILSVSPYHKYDVPYLESDVGMKCPSRIFITEEIYWSNLFDDRPSRRTWSKNHESEFNYNSTSSKLNVKLAEPHAFITCKMTAPLSDQSTQTMLADFRARGGRVKVMYEDSHSWEISRMFSTASTNSEFMVLQNPLVSDKVDCLDPFNHQKISVLFSNFSPKSFNFPNHCVLPWVVTMEFYGNNDISLGAFLQRFCFRESYMCPSTTCETSILDHVRRFSHGKGCIDIVLKKLDTQILGAQNYFLMWSWCRVCKQVTPLVPMSADTWNLSFAKYLELRFYGDKFQRRATAEHCPHSLHFQHYQYFGHKDILVSFKYTEIQLKELALPPILISINTPQFKAEQMKDQVLLITNRSMERYSEILECTLNIKSEIQNETSARNLSEYVTEQQTEKSQLRELASKIQEKIEEIDDQCSCARKMNASGLPTLTLSEIFDDIIRLKRLTTEAVVRWNTKIQEFLSYQQKKTSRPTSSSRKDRDNLDEVDRNSPSQPQSAKTSGDNNQPIISVISSQLLENNDAVDSPDSIFLPVPSETLTSNSSTDRLQLQIPDSAGILEDSPDGRSGERKSASVKRALMFWSGPSFHPLALPYDACEHYLLPPCERVPIVVYDNEPSSIVAYALSSGDYHIRLKEIQASLRSVKESDTASIASSKLSEGGSGSNHSSKRSSGGVLSFFRGSSIPRDVNNIFSRTSPSLDSVRYNAQLDTDIIEGASEPDSLAGVNVTNDNVDKPKPTMKQSVGPHIEIQFCDNLARFYCRIYFAENFRKLRKLIFPAGEDAFIRSLSRCKLWEAKGGKSGSTFCKTDDDRFILKQMSGMEVESFEKFGPQYFNYISKTSTEKRPIALAKIVGVFRIGFRNTLTNTANKQDLLVVENLFYNRKISQKFDLKGSMRNRMVKTPDKGEEELVLLDENLLKLSVDSPLYIRPHSKTVLKTAITSDTHFLSTNLVMDYSLIVGLDEVNQELVVGIIDYIRTFTWDKKLEMVFKSSGLMGGHGKMPTVVSPQLYRSRFLEAMERYFLHVPDQWSGLGKDYPGPVDTTDTSNETDKK